MVLGILWDGGPCQLGHSPFFSKHHADLFGGGLWLGCHGYLLWAGWGVGMIPDLALGTLSQAHLVDEF